MVCFLVRRLYYYDRKDVGKTMKEISESVRSRLEHNGMAQLIIFTLTSQSRAWHDARTSEALHPDRGYMYI